MNYRATIDYLYNCTPQFQRIGAAAYKPGLDTVRHLAEAFGNPQYRYKVIHVAGTNGKGSTSHTLAAVLQSAGLKVGLYTSPHLIDFRERIRVNGSMIPEEDVIRFVQRYRELPQASDSEPSFFELTTVMAFDWFAREKVDVAVIEVGLGGRLDSTNIVEADLSVITNISFDHTAQLGHTLEEIAHEKAGIMRKGVPVVCGEPNLYIRGFLAAEAAGHMTSIRFALDEENVSGFENGDNSLRILGSRFGNLAYQLTGDCQQQNARTVLCSIDELCKLGWDIPSVAVKEGFANVCTLTGLMGRWMSLSSDPLVVCDTGHNIGGWEMLSGQLKRLPRPLTVVLGFVNDKDIAPILPLLPRDAEYIFTNASIPRALPAGTLAEEAGRLGLKGECVPTVAEAYEKGLGAMRGRAEAGSMFVGGSTFIVADLLAYLHSAKNFS